MKCNYDPGDCYGAFPMATGLSSRMPFQCMHVWILAIAPGSAVLVADEQLALLQFCVHVCSCSVCQLLNVTSAIMSPTVTCFHFMFVVNTFFIATTFIFLGECFYATFACDSWYLSHYASMHLWLKILCSRLARPKLFHCIKHLIDYLCVIFICYHNGLFWLCSCGHATINGS